MIAQMCGLGDHDICAHKFGVEGSLFTRKSPRALLCGCCCHSSCPLWPARKVPTDEWTNRCRCCGSAGLREIEAEVNAESEERNARDSEVFRDLKIEPRQSAEAIQQQILAAYRAHGYEPSSDFSRWSRFIAAGQARRGTRTLRLFIEAVSGLRAARRWWVDHRDGPSDADPTG